MIVRQMPIRGVSLLLMASLLGDPCRALAVGWTPSAPPLTFSKSSYQTQALTLMLLAAAWTGVAPHDPMVLRQAAQVSRSLGSNKKRLDRMGDDGYLPDGADSRVLSVLSGWLENGFGSLSESPLVFHYSHETVGRRVLHRIEVSVENVYAGHIDFVFNRFTRRAWMDVAFDATTRIREAIEVVGQFREQGIGHRLIELAALLLQLEGATRFTAKQVHIETSHFYLHSGFRVARRPDWFLRLSLESKAKGRLWPYWFFPIMDFRMEFNAPPSKALHQPLGVAA